MKVEEAIKSLMRCEAESYCRHYTETFRCDGCNKRKALDMAIEAIKNEINCVKCEHYTERETYTGIKGVCKMDTAHRGDTISRQSVIELVKNSYYNLAENMDDVWAMVADVEQIPSAEPKHKTGKWKQVIPANAYECSKCGQYVMTDDIEVYKFCHGCGADMR